MFSSQYDTWNRFIGNSKCFRWPRYSATLYKQKYLDGINIIDARLFGESIIMFREPDFDHPEDIHIRLPFVITQLVPFFNKFLPQFRTDLVGTELRMQYQDEPGFFTVTNNMVLRIVDGRLSIRRDFEMR